MFEGSHIHFSPVDRKPLCSYSGKLCKQRRINSYAFCIRHILEDKSAPFKQCSHVAKYNQQKCSNAIPANEERHFCNSHMQIAGITPKKERKALSAEKAMTANTTAVTATNTSIATSSSSHLTVNCNNSKANNNSGKRDIKRAKRKRKDNKAEDKLVLARMSKNSEHLFRYHIWTSSDDEDNSDTDADPLGADDLNPPLFAALIPRVDQLEANELKKELTTQKWLLMNLISTRQKELNAEIQSTRALLSTLKSLNGFSYVDYKLMDGAQRSSASITKGVCCYASDEWSCARPSLPYSRHCVQHILYNVDQLLFSRCTAKCAKTMTQCSRATFDITREEPLCLYHQSAPPLSDLRPVSPAPDGKAIKRRKKTKPMALTRVSRRGKKRRKVGNDVNVVESCIESVIESEAIAKEEEVVINEKINLLPSPPPSLVIDHIVVPSLPQSNSSSSPLASIARPLRLHLSANSPTPSSVVMDTSVMPPPPPLEPIEEAFVASIVADLPQLSNDADFTEVLNKIPDDAFSEFLLDHQNGEGPSSEETEALEQALAMVNKDMQNMVAAVTVNGGNNSQGAIDFNGQSDILGFANWFGSLTSEQRHQLNGLIDGAIASNSLSPILKSACETFPTPVMKTNTSPAVTNNAYSSQNMSLPSTSQEFVSISPTVPLFNNSLLMNGLSSHPS